MRSLVQGTLLIRILCQCKATALIASALVTVETLWVVVRRGSQSTTGLPSVSARRSSTAYICCNYRCFTQNFSLFSAFVATDAKRVRDFNDAQAVDPTTGQPAAFPETSPFVGIRCGGCGPDGGFSGDLPGFPGAGGPIGWQTYQPVTQLWLYKYYGDLETMRASFNQTYAYVKMLEAAVRELVCTN